MSVILLLADAAAHLPPRGALIGLDLGTKTIGVAASDPDRKLATGVETVARKTFSVDAKHVLALRLNGTRLGLCSAFRSTWMAAKALGRSRPVHSRATWQAHRIADRPMG